MKLFGDKNAHRWKNPFARRGARGPAPEKQDQKRYGGLVGFVLVICACVVLFSGYKIAEKLLEYKQGTDAYTALEEYLRPPPARPTAQSAPPEEVPPESGVDWPLVDFDGLRAVNADLAAWLICPGTEVNYPVAHGADNSFYLTHMFDLTYNKSGTLFVDARNSAGFLDRNTIIYGHNMRNHSMFWTLTQYKTQAYYDAHPTMWILTPEGNYTLELFAGYVASPDDDAWRIDFSGDDAYMDWLYLTAAGSTFQSTGVQLLADDRVVTLSTCSYEYNNARYIVVGKLVPALDGAY
jgi:sortase B